VAQQGLEDQLLGELVRQERPELEEQRDRLVVSIAADKKQLVQLEDRVLKLLKDAAGNILDDEVLITTLNNSKATSGKGVGGDGFGTAGAQQVLVTFVGVYCWSVRCLARVGGSIWSMSPGARQVVVWWSAAYIASPGAQQPQQLSPSTLCAWCAGSTPRPPQLPSKRA
jgi:hypothetical protein